MARERHGKGWEVGDIKVRERESRVWEVGGSEPPVPSLLKINCIK